jgi:ribosomal protein S18 acetylase RimI-like enzyme
MKCRPLTHQDIPEIVAFEETARDYYALIGEAQPNEQSTKNAMETLPPGRCPADKHFLGVFQQENMIALVDLVEGYPDGETLYIGLLVISQENRHKGYGTVILHEIQQMAQNKNLHFLELAVHDANDIGRAFWDKTGFKPQRSAEVNGKAVTVMRKDVTGENE